MKVILNMLTAIPAILPAAVFTMTICLFGCSYQTYSSKPVDAAATASEFHARTLKNAGFRDYLKSHDYKEDQLSLSTIGMRELLYCALFFHPKLDVARAEWRAAKARALTAGQRPNPGISGNLEHHSRTDGNVSPWTLGLAIDLPIETANKRQFRIDEASHLSEAARIDIAQTAWQLRSNVRDVLLKWHVAQQRIMLLQQGITLREEIAAILQKRLNLGMVSSVELANANILLQKMQQTLVVETSQLPALRAEIAAAAGLSEEALTSVTLDTAPFESLYPPDQLPDGKLRRAALLNRLDIRSALARYGARESKLRLEIARQYPDIVLSPGYAYDQGDNLWSLGFSTLLQLLNRNEGPIAEASAARDIEAAKFLQLQAAAINDQEQASARYQAGWDMLAGAEKTFATQSQAYERIQRQFQAGQIDRLELAIAHLEKQAAEQVLHQQRWSLLQARHALEDAIQQPLEQISIGKNGIESMLPDNHKEQTPERQP